jgi:hypothetical protein
VWIERTGTWKRIPSTVAICPSPRLQELWSAIAVRVSRSELELATDAVHRLASQPDARDGQDAAFREELLRRYQSLRRFMPVLLDAVSFEAAPGGQAVLDAIASLRALDVDAVAGEAIERAVVGVAVKAPEPLVGR